MPMRRIAAGELKGMLGHWRTGGREPAYRQLAGALRLLILDGRLPIAARLPGERDFAAALQVSRTTTAAAFAELRAAAMLTSRHGSGSVVALPVSPRDAPASMASAPVELDFSIAAPPAGPEIHLAFRHALDRLPMQLRDTGYDRLGLDALRATVADRYTARGLPTSVDEVMIVNGALSGFALCLRLLTGPGDRVVVDAPTYPAAIEAIRAAGGRPVSVPLGDAGWDAPGMTATFAQTTPVAAYLIADNHNPTGRTMTADERAAIARAAASSCVTVIADETMVDLWYERPPPPPLAAFDETNRTITLGSTSKSFWGGLRIAWVRAQAATIAALAQVRETLDLGTPVLEQLAVAELLASGDATLAARRDDYRARRDRLCATGCERFPAWRFPVPAGGLSCWVELPEPIATILAAAAESSGLRIAPGVRFGTGGAFDRFLRLPFVADADATAAMLDRLDEAWRRVAQRPPRAPRHGVVA